MLIIAIKRPFKPAATVQLFNLLVYEITEAPTEQPTEEVTTEEMTTIPNKELCENYMATDSGNMFYIFVLYGVIKSQYLSNNINLNVIFNNILTTKYMRRRLIMPPNAAPMDMKKSRRKKVVKRHVVC